MEKPCTMSHDVTIGRLLGQTFGYIGQNWKPLLVLFGLTYLAVEIASWGVGEFMGASSGQTSSFVMMVPALLLEAICLPFVVDDRPFFLSQWSASYNNQDGKKDTSTIQRVFSWLFLRNLSLVIFLVMGYFLAQSSLPFFLFVGVLVCWLLLIFWVFIRLCFLGPLLACGDAVKGGLAIKISWESVKGLVLPIGLSYGLVLGLGVSISFLLGTVCTIFFDMGEGATGVGSSLLLLALDVFADIWSVLPIVLVGVAYRFKRDAALRLIKASQ